MTIPLTRRRRMLAVVVLVAVAVAAAGVTSPWWVKSPQQVAAEAKPPAATVLTAKVGRKALRDTVVLRGTIGPTQAVEVTPAARGESTLVITAVRVKAADQIVHGAVLLEVSGRPLFVLKGTTPGYRDLKPGLAGNDVAQLQSSLASLGHDPGERSGTFGAGTKRALAAFYASRGYTPRPVSDTDAKQVEQAKRQVIAARRQVTDAQEAVDALTKSDTSTQEQRSQAVKALARAKEDLTAANKECVELERTTGPMLPMGEFVFLSGFPARVDSLNAVVGGGVQSPLVTLSTGALVVKATVTAAQRPLCRAGSSVDINGDTGLSVKGKVTSVADTMTNPQAGSAQDSKQAAPVAGGATSGYLVMIEPTTALDAKSSGQSVRLIVESQVSSAESLVVPVTALYSGADGAVYVTRHDSDGSDHRVMVEAGQTAQGYVAIIVRDGVLNVDDLVTVGVGQNQ